MNIRRVHYAFERLCCCFALVALMSAVEPPVAIAQAPNCTSAVPDDGNSDDAAINACLSNGGTVVLDTGVYLIANSLSMTVDDTRLLGAGGFDSSGASGTVLRAISSMWGPIIDVEADDFEIADVYIDGDVGNRTYEYTCSSSWNGGYRWQGYNVQITGSGFSVHDSTIAKAMCGTGMEVEGSGFEIYNNTFWANGIPEDWTASGNQPWADGLTLLLCDGGSVYDNDFIDNTDIGVVSGGTGGGNPCVIEANFIANWIRRGFAGIHVGYFAGGDGDHDGSSYSYNEVTAYYNKAAFGIAVGFHPWSTSYGNLSHAGSVANNSISGGVVGLAVDGVDDGAVSGNSIGSPSGDDGFGSCTIADDYTAAHFGNASLQGGHSCRYYDNGSCAGC
jgi:hypothetical protein